MTTQDLGNKIFDISKLAIPTFGSSGPAVPPFYLRTPSRSNFDVSFFKNFNISESKKIQFRTGLFNVFNQAYPTLTNVTATNLQGSDIFLALDTVCLRTVANVPNGIGGTVTAISAIQRAGSASRTVVREIEVTPSTTLARSLICTAAELWNSH